MDKFNNFFETVIKTKFPKAQVKFKDENTFMKVLGILIYIFNPRFMTDYVTTIGTTIYFPTKKEIENNVEGSIGIAAHEFVHMCDEEKLDSKYCVLAYKCIYLFPQILGIFSLLAFFAFLNTWWLLCLLFLLFLAPIPAPGRVYLEVRGYAMNLYILAEHRCPTYRVDDTIQQTAKMYAEFQFVGPSYYFMASNKDKVIKMLLDNYKILPMEHFAFKSVQCWYNDQNANKTLPIQS